MFTVVHANSLILFEAKFKMYHFLGDRKKAHWKKAHRKKAHWKKAHRKKAHRKKAHMYISAWEKSALGKKRTMYFIVYTHIQSFLNLCRIKKNNSIKICKVFTLIF